MLLIKCLFVQRAKRELVVVLVQTMLGQRAWAQGDDLGHARHTAVDGHDAGVVVVEVLGQQLVALLQELIGACLRL